MTHEPVNVLPGFGFRGFAMGRVRTHPIHALPSLCPGIHVGLDGVEEEACGQRRRNRLYPVGGCLKLKKSCRSLVARWSAKPRVPWPNIPSIAFRMLPKSYCRLLYPAFVGVWITGASLEQLNEGLMVR